MVNEQLTDRVREALVNATDVTEKRMFGGICFMVDDKMCICVRDNQLMCRVGPDEYETAVEENGPGNDTRRQKYERVRLCGCRLP
jgi:TfoX/Sxy family transcriptional regulator of competence genes